MRGVRRVADVPSGPKLVSKRCVSKAKAGEAANASPPNMAMRAASVANTRPPARGTNPPATTRTTRGGGGGGGVRNRDGPNAAVRRGRGALAGRGGVLNRAGLV